MKVQHLGYLIALGGTFCLPLTSLASGGHDHDGADLTVVVDDNGEIEVEYPFSVRPTVRLSATPLDGVFSSTSPGFIPGEGNGTTEFELPVGTTVEFELVRREGDVSFAGKLGATASLPGESVIIGTHSCAIDVDSICVGGSNAGFTCTGDGDCPGGTCTGDCEPDTSDLHQHGEFFLVTSDNYTFAEGAITFRLRDADDNLEHSDEYTLKLSNGPLPALDPGDLLEAKAANKCRRALAKEVRSFSSKQYGLIARCLDAIFAAEELGKSEKAAVKACDTPILAGRIDTLLTKAVAKLDKTCEKNTPGAFGPFSESNVRTHMGMAACRTQELVGAAYAESVAEMVEILSECDGNLCVAGPNKGMACSDAEDCEPEEIEEAIEEAFPCLRMTQASES